MRQYFKWRAALVGGIALAAALGTTVTTMEHARAEDDADAKPACLALGNFIKSGDRDGLRAFFDRVTQHRIPAPSVDQLVLVASYFGAGNPRIEGPTFLAERKYGDVLHRDWYVLIKDGRPLYLRCISVLTQGHWLLENFDMQDSRAKLPLP